MLKIVKNQEIKDVDPDETFEFDGVLASGASKRVKADDIKLE